MITSGEEDFAVFIFKLTNNFKKNLERIKRRRKKTNNERQSHHIFNFYLNNGAQLQYI